MSTHQETITEFVQEIKRIQGDPKLPEEVKAAALYAWVEQKIQNEQGRQHQRTGRCPFCGHED